MKAETLTYRALEDGSGVKCDDIKLRAKTFDHGQVLGAARLLA